jgi:hypothetical protein
MSNPTYGDYLRYMQEAHDYARLYGLTGPHNGDIDVFRHAYASAEMTREFGETWAIALGNLNEIKGDLSHGQPLLERNMDLWNNAKGREIGHYSSSKADTASRVLAELKSDGLIRGLSDPRAEPGYFPSDLWVPATMSDPLTGFEWPGIDLDTNLWYQKALTWHWPADPLVLDGDGIEATAIDPASPILFDHDANGIKTATGWIKADDGIVVLDLDGNGSIDTGRELFGDNTLLSDGTRATNGFAAIAQHDANADGKINSQDAVYSQLRIWQDANQDGTSQAGELHTLAELGIASINVTGSASDITLGNGNSQPRSGSYTRVNGTTGTSGTPELSGSLLLAANDFYRDARARIPSHY